MRAARGRIRGSIVMVFPNLPWLRPRVSPDPFANKRLTTDVLDRGEDPRAGGLSLARRLIDEWDEVLRTFSAAVRAGKLVDAQGIAASHAIPRPRQFRGRARRG